MICAAKLCVQFRSSLSPKAWRNYLRCAGCAPFQLIDRRRTTQAGEDHSVGGHLGKNCHRRLECQLQPPRTFTSVLNVASLSQTSFPSLGSCFCGGVNPIPSHAQYRAVNGPNGRNGYPRSHNCGRYLPFSRLLQHILIE